MAGLAISEVRENKDMGRAELRWQGKISNKVDKLAKGARHIWQRTAHPSTYGRKAKGVRIEVVPWFEKLYSRNACSRIEATSKFRN